MSFSVLKKKPSADNPEWPTWAASERERLHAELDRQEGVTDSPFGVQDNDGWFATIRWW